MYWAENAVNESKHHHCNCVAPHAVANSHCHLRRIQIQIDCHDTIFWTRLDVLIVEESPGKLLCGNLYHKHRERLQGRVHPANPPGWQDPIESTDTVTQSPSQPVSQASSHPVTQSPSHPVIQSSRHPVTQSSAQRNEANINFTVHQIRCLPKFAPGFSRVDLPSTPSRLRFVASNWVRVGTPMRHQPGCGRESTEYKQQYKTRPRLECAGKSFPCGTCLTTSLF
jgi:hypothetical protein